MSLNLNPLVYTSSDYKIVLSAKNSLGMTITAPLFIVEDLGYGAKKEVEYIHAIGDDEPRALKTNTSTYPGKLTIEAGELENFLLGLGIVFATQIQSFNIAIIAGANLVKAFKNCVFDSHDATIKAKDKRSLISLNFNALGVNGI
jgi:hypothetical protein